MMFKPVAFSFLMILSISATAQFSKGTRMVGATIGSIFYNNSDFSQDVASIGGTESTTSSFGLNLSPSMGWFVSENTAVGFTFLFNPQHQKVSYKVDGTTYQQNKTNSFSIGLGGFARNYFSASGNWLPFGQVNLNAGISPSKTEGFFYGGGGSAIYKETMDGKSSGSFFFNGGVSAGLTKKLNENIGLDLFIGYNYSMTQQTFKRTTLVDIGNDGSIDETRRNETETDYSNHGFTAGIGFQIFLKKRGK